MENNKINTEAILDFVILILTFANYFIGGLLKNLIDLKTILSRIKFHISSVI